MEISAQIADIDLATRRTSSNAPSNRYFNKVFSQNFAQRPAEKFCY